MFALMTRIVGLHAVCDRAREESGIGKDTRGPASPREDSPENMVGWKGISSTPKVPLHTGLLRHTDHMQSNEGQHKDIISQRSRLRWDEDRR